MKRAIIFANGSMEQPPAILHSLLPDDLIIAADGGTNHCKSLGLTPVVIIGDLDSLQQEEVSYYKLSGVEIIQYPRQKDETDLELALQLALKRKADRVYIIGALGARWDMTLANVLLIAHPDFSKMSIRLVEGAQEILLLRGGQQVDLYSRAGTPISLIPLAGDAHGITALGLEYPLEDESLFFGSSRGVSNVFLRNRCTIAIRDGLLLCFYTAVNDRGELIDIGDF